MWCERRFTMPEKGKTLFISDIHLGAGNTWDWFSIEKEGPYLVKFFEYVSQRTDVKELVLLGDVFDTWVCPHDREPHKFEDIIKAQVKVINAIKKMAEKVPTLYINGNHDYSVTAENINNTFDGKVKHIGTYYRRRNIYAEHGHLQALFNCPDPRNGGFLRLPLGYYITRLHTTLGITRKAKMNLILEGLDAIFQVMGPEKLPESLLDALKDAVEKTKKTEVTEFKMGYICAYKGYETVKSRYKNLFDDWKASVGFWQSVQMIKSEMNRLDTVADQMCRDGVDIVVLGHSHDTKMDKDSWLAKDRIYANCGYWCGFGDQESIDDNAHFVETDGKTVTLFSFTGKKAREKKSLRL